MATALDANVLLRLAQKQHPLYSISRSAVRTLEAEGEKMYYLPQNVVEYWNVATRPPSARGGFGLTLREADQHVRMMERLFTLLPDTPDIHAEWRRLVVQVGISGVQVHDAHCGLSART